MDAYRKGFTLVELMIVIVVIGVLATIALSLSLRIAEKGNITMLESDLNKAYKAALVFHTDNPEDDIDLDKLKEYGFSQSAGVSINVVDATAGGLKITATHQSVAGVYGVDHTGKIAKQ